MSGMLQSSIVRILTGDGAIVGAGFLVGERQIITCAHVVADALMLTSNSEPDPESVVQVDFPFLSAGILYTARVLRWLPVSGDAPRQVDLPDDVAVLTLESDAPTTSRPAMLVKADAIWKHPFRAFGFPRSQDNGVWARGVVLDRQVGGWVQIEGENEIGYFVAPGFSGTAVWDDQLDGVIGMVVGAERRAQVRAAFMIPVTALAAAWPDLDRRTTPPCPYRGLFAFREDDESVFFGRQTFAARLVKAARAKSFVAVIGPSGSGKSSVVFAGLLPRLRREGGWLVASFRPGSSPLRSLAAALLTLLEPEKSEVDRLVDTAKLADALDKRVVSMGEICERILAKDPAARHLLLVADQFEELYSLSLSEAERQCFLDTILFRERAGSSVVQTPFTLVLTLRADFVGHALSYRPCADALQDADVKLGPMTREELRDAIEGPARQRGVTIEDGLTERILEGIQEAPGNLPLLEFALTELWARQSNRQLTHTAYDDIGGVGQALAAYATEKFGELDPIEKAKGQRILLQSVRPGEGHGDTRRQARRSEIGEENWALVARLADMRLIVTGRDETTGEETIEIVHEALIREWKELRAWSDADRTFRIWQERLRAALYQWQESARDSGALLRGYPLAEAEEWLATRRADVSPAEQAYVEASLAARQKDQDIERERVAREGDLQKKASEALVDKIVVQQRLTTRLRYLIGVLLVSAAVAVGLAVFAFNSQHQAQLNQIEAQNQAQIALSRQLAAEGMTQSTSRPDLALLLSVAAYKTFPTTEARGSLLTGLIRSAGRWAPLTGHTGPVWSVAFSPDGKTLASSSSDRTIILWDVVSRHPIGSPLTGHTGPVQSVAFSPDGKTLASGSSDRTIILWDVTSRQPLGAPLTGHTGLVVKVAFSPDGKTLASASVDQTVRLWDVITREASGSPMTGHTMSVSSVAFSPDGKTLASSSVDQTIRFWDVASRQPLGLPLTGFTLTSVSSVAFSPDGKMLASASFDQTIRLWDVTSHQSLGIPLTGHTAPVWSVAFSPDGKTLASASVDQTVRLWDVATRQPLGLPLLGHTDNVWSVAFSPDGRTIASASYDQTVRLWDIASHPSLGVPLTGHTGPVWSVAFSPDGKTVASASADQTVRLWDIANRQSLGMPLTGHTDAVAVVAFSPDGKILASAGYDRTIRLWDVANHQPIGTPLLGHTDAIWSMAFSSDGKMLASAGVDRTIRLWDVATHQQLGVPLTGQSETVTSVAFSPDGKILASGSRDHTIRLWDVASRQVFGSPLTGHTDIVWHVAFSPDGKMLASSGGDHTIRLWDVASRQLLGVPLTGHTNAVSSVAFSPDGKTLVSASYDQTVRLWDVASRQPLGVALTGHTQNVWSVAFSPDGKTIASASDDGTVRLWEDMASDLWPVRACGVAGRNLTKDEWRQYVGDAPYLKACSDFL